MKTEVQKRFKRGFVLDEQELRRIVQACNEHVGKLNLPEDQVTRSFKAKLKNGAVVETDDLGQILDLENIGTTAVVQVHLEFHDVSDDPTWRIHVTFENAATTPDSWISQELIVTGQSRDWAFLAGADLEERLKKVQTLSWAFLASRTWMLLLLIVVCVGVGLTTMVYLIDSAKMKHDIALRLEEARQKGDIKDPVDAIILAEREKAKRPSPGSLLAMTFLPAFGVVAIVLLLYAVVRGNRTYNFYWGDYIVCFDTYKSRIKLFWTAVVLATGASVLGGIILRLM